MIFEQVGEQYHYEDALIVNDEIYSGKWVIRQNNGLKQWVVEWVATYNSCSFMLPVQRLYSSLADAVQVAADASQLGTIMSKGKWYPNRMNGPAQPSRYELLHQPVSNINWA